MKLINPKNGEEFASKYDTHKAARTALKARLTAEEWADPAFPQAIYDSTDTEAKQTPGRVFWLHKLATGGAKRSVPVASGKYDLSGLLNILNTAKSNGLKHPAVTLTTPKGVEVKLAVAGDRSRYTGAVMVASSSYGGPYYGMIMPEGGEFFPGKDFTPEIGTLLDHMAADPKGTAQAQGHLTGRCCFCRKVLDDAKSTALGYGPVCAKKFGLEHSAKAVARKQIVRDSGLRETAKPKVKAKSTGARRVVRRIESV